MLPNNIPIPFPIIFKPTPNFEIGRKGIIPDAICIHIAEGLRDSVYQTFLNEQKSSHFLVNQDGTLWQFVGTNNTAWGNGIVDNPISELVLQRRQGAVSNPNYWTISVEHEGFSTSDITPAQYDMTVKLIKYLSQKWNIPLDRTHIIKHTEIEASKTCPGLINTELIIQKARMV